MFCKTETTVKLVEWTQENPQAAAYFQPKNIEGNSYGSVNAQLLESAKIRDSNLCERETKSKPLRPPRNKLIHHYSVVRGHYLHTREIRKSITSKKVAKPPGKPQTRRHLSQIKTRTSVYLSSLDFRKSTSFALKAAIEHNLMPFRKKPISVYVLKDIIVARACNCSGREKRCSNLPSERSEEHTGNLRQERQPIAEQNGCQNQKSSVEKEKQLNEPSPKQTFKKKRNTLQGGDTPDSIFYKDPPPYGALDDKTIRQHQMDEEFYRAQNYLFNPSRRQNRRQNWYYRLLSKHVFQKWLNPLDTFQAKRYANDWHGPPLGTVEWRRGQPRSWACGCPARPCVCHFNSNKPPAKIPKSEPQHGTDSPRLLERVEQRVRIEEQLHEKMEDLPPPCGQPIENLFGLGLMPSRVEQQLMGGPLVAATERARCESILRRNNLKPGEPICGTIGYNDTLKSMRGEAAKEVIAKQGYNIEAKEDSELQFIKKKCEEIRKNKPPFPTRAMCYRVEEVRANRLRAPRDVDESARAGGTRREGRVTPPAGPPTSFLTVLTSKRPRIGAALRLARRIEATNLRRQQRRVAKICPDLRISDTPAVTDDGKEKSEKHQATHVSTAEDSPLVREATRRQEKQAINANLGSQVGKRSSRRTSQYDFMTDGLEPAPAEKETLEIVDQNSENCVATELAPAPKDASQSTSELTSSIVRKNEDMNHHKQKTRWKSCRQNFNNLYQSLKDITKSLDPGTGAWKTKNFKYWFCCCWSNSNSVRRNTTCYNVTHVDDLYPHLAQLIQDEERYRDVLLLHKCLLNTNISKP